jgi:mRNA interferase RelE/StbE
VTRFKVLWSPGALREFEKLDRSIQRRVAAKLDQVAEDPHRWAARLVGYPSFRVRVGDIRIIIDIDDATVQVLVLQIRHRRNVYR